LASLASANAAFFNALAAEAETFAVSPGPFIAAIILSSGVLESATVPSKFH
jgi:hypothetical protein